MPEHNDPIVIVAAKRTAMGAFNCAFTDVPAPALGAAVIRSLLTESGVSADHIDTVTMGCVLPAATGQAPARQAALLAELPQSVHCATVNKVCGSGLQTILYAHDAVQLGRHEIAIAGGMENMTRAPHMLPKNALNRLGHASCLSHLFTDGLEDAYSGKLMGEYAEATAEKYAFSREAQDDFAITSLQRAQAASHAGQFAAEIAPVTVKTRRDEVVVTSDEPLAKAKPDKIPQLKPAFAKNGTVTAANASSIADGAAAVLLMKQSKAQSLGLTPMAKIAGLSTFSHQPEWFTTAPVGALQQLVDSIDWSVADVDRFEINEAFAVVTMAAMHDLQIPHEKVNVHGGACALGHPLGASGARVLVTLLHTLRAAQLKRGVAGLCIGGGEAIAVAVEML